LTGNGVVIGVSDTGIDENSCYFVDPTHGKVPRSDNLLCPHTDNKYRKIIQYVNYSGSNGDYNDGHGSHVAGTLAGKDVLFIVLFLSVYFLSSGYCSMYSAAVNIGKNTRMGMSSSAKIAVFDMGMDDSAQDLVLPEDMKYVYHPAAMAGAHIHSNSWGGDVFYDSLALETDSYLYNNPSFTTFFAAGNSGSLGKETILSPGTSKNSIAVGCGETGHQGGQNVGYISSFSSNGPTLDGRIKPDVSGNWQLSVFLSYFRFLSVFLFPSLPPSIHRSWKSYLFGKSL
jgi:subtilisin family serine protease